MKLHKAIGNFCTLYYTAVSTVVAAVLDNLSNYICQGRYFAVMNKVEYSPSTLSRLHQEAQKCKDCKRRKPRERRKNNAYSWLTQYKRHSVY